MNRNLDGSPLTTADLVKIAKDAGVSDKVLAGVHMLHNANLIRSALSDMTADARFDLFCAGKLRLDTRTPANSSTK